MKLGLTQGALALSLSTVFLHTQAQAQKAAPTLTCSAAPRSVNAGDPVTVSAAASSTTGQALTVSFQTAAGSLAPNGNRATLHTSGVAPGALKITCHATDAAGQTSSATTSVWINGAPGEQALPAFSFTDSVGANVHLHFSGTPYWDDFPNFYRSIVASGIRHYRNGIDAFATPYEFGNAQTLGRAGVKADWMISANCGADCISNIDRAAHYSIDAFEGPNEYDADSLESLPNEMALIHNVVKANPRTANVPVFAASPQNVTKAIREGSMAPFVDFGNMHDYYGTRPPETAPYGGTLFNCPNYGDLTYNLCVAADTVPGRPAVTTETGYASGFLSDTTIGKYITRTLMNHLSAGVMRTYIFEYADAPGGLQNGLVHRDLSPKPAYTGIRNLISLFGDGTLTAPGKFDYNLGGDLYNVRHVLFQKADGTYMLALWLGVQSAQLTPPFSDYNIPAQTVTVTTGTPVGPSTIVSLDPSGNLYPLTPSTNGNVTTLPVTDRITVISFAPPAANNAASVNAPANNPPGSLSPNASYTFSAGASNLCIDLANASFTDRTPILQWTCIPGHPTQKWQLQPTDSGYFRIGSFAAPNRVFDVEDISSANGAPLHLFMYVGGINQQWLPVSLGNGFYKFVGRGSNRCLNIPEGYDQYATRLQIADCDNSAGESFQLTQQP